MLNTTCATNFVACVTTFRIVVLTWNRPIALTRLLSSLERSYYHHGWNIILEIHIDGGGGENGDKVRDVAAAFDFSHGEKVILAKAENEGALAAWKSVWSWKENELFIMIEDDAELSPYWYLWLSNAWHAYGKRDDMAAISLYKQTYVVWPKPDMVDISSMVEGPVFLYRVPALFCNSPHPLHWYTFMKEYGHQLGPCPPGMNCCGIDGKCKEKDNEKEKELYQDQDVEPWLLKYNQNLSTERSG